MQTENTNLPITKELIGLNLLERYTGSKVDAFQKYIILTNFSAYVELFAEFTNTRVHHGSAMNVCHDDRNNISIINYGVGSPVAALVIDLISLIHPIATINLGLCGGLRDEFHVGEYFNPVAAIREEGTSMAYIPARCPALSSFVIQRFICDELEQSKLIYHNGVIHTTNVRFWEFNEDFKKNLIEEKAQAIDMECATLFSVGYARRIPVGALMLITDLPFKLSGIKTKASSEMVFKDYAENHVKIAITVLKNMQKKESEGFNYEF